MQQQNWPRFSMVTTNFNMAPYLGQAMDSILGQQYPNLDYVVMDAGSTDASNEIIEARAGQLSHWESKPDKGMYDGLQKGFELTKGEIMGYLNSDDLLWPGALHSVAQIFKDYPEIEWVTGIPTAVNRHGHMVSIEAFRAMKWSKFKYFIGEFDWIQQESTFWRRSLWEKAGGYIDKELQYAGDFDLWMRFFRHAKLYTVQTGLGAFRHRGEEQKSKSALDQYFREVHEVANREEAKLGTADQATLKALRRLEKTKQRPLFRSLKRYDFQKIELMDYAKVLVWSEKEEKFVPTER